ncbi:MAG: hypothetical protein J6125_04340 [Clostridia bacterium]|nr:hypothetical protein [Clostridia bacterium]
MLEGVLPYESKKLIPFTSSYLTGFVAKKRDVERAAVTDEVRGRMNRYANELLRATVKGYTTVQVESCRVQVYHSNWDYTLFPIWMLVYRGRKKDYTFALNGSSGKIWGEVPVSRLKLWLFGAILAAAAFGLAWLLGGAVL